MYCWLCVSLSLTVCLSDDVSPWWKWLNIGPRPRSYTYDKMLSSEIVFQGTKKKLFVFWIVIFSLSLSPSLSFALSPHPSLYRALRVPRVKRWVLFSHHVCSFFYVRIKFLLYHFVEVVEKTCIQRGSLRTQEESLRCMQTWLRCGAFYATTADHNVPDVFANLKSFAIFKIILEFTNQRHGPRTPSTPGDEEMFVNAPLNTRP